MSPFEWGVVLFAIFGSAVIKNSVGIGAGIFMLPVLALVLPVKVALGLGAPAMLLSDVMGCRSYFKEWSNKEVLMILPAALIGIGLGAFLVDVLPSGPFCKVVGGMAVLFALVSLRNLYFVAKPASAPAWLHSRPSGISIGFLGGVVTTLAHAGGIVWSVYLIQKKLPKREFVGTIVFLFLITNLLKTVSYLFIGILNTDGLFTVLVSIPFIIVGGLAGNYLNKRMPLQIFRCVVLLIIAVMGLDLMLK